ncbi:MULTISPECIES: hypothetical protein [unclassified Exiguobacterium]|nr:MULTISPECIES: hypothetical protein [unclassified Exiguobacterium]MTD31923.1 hypothetical protein [Planomicrobium sp. YIM 101495]
MFQMKLIKKLKTSYEIVMSNDNRYLCHTMGSKTIVYDTYSWEKVIELPKPKHPGYIKFSQDGQWFYIKNTTGTICAYNTSDFQLYRTIQSRKSFQTVEVNFEIMENPLIILDTININNSKQIAIFNIETGEYHVLTDLDSTHITYHQFIQNKNSYLFTVSNLDENDNVEQSILFVSNPLTNPLISIWKLPDILLWDSIIYDPVHNVYIMVNRYELIFFESDLKTILRKEKFIDKEKLNVMEIFYHIHVSNDGNFIVITFSQRVLILRFDDLSPIFVEEIPDACFAEFSKNDKYLLVGTWSNGFVFENNLK